MAINRSFSFCYTYYTMIEENKATQGFYNEQGKKYKSYNDTKVNEIMGEINKPDKDGYVMSLRSVASKYNINYSTLRNKFNKFKNNIKPKSRGGTNKLFTKDQEKSLSEWVQEVFINNKLFFDDDCLRITAIKKYNLLYKANLNHISDGWIFNFKKRWTSVRCSYSRTASANVDEKTKEFLDTSTNRYKSIPHDRIFNMDEIFFRMQ